MLYQQTTAVKKILNLKKGLKIIQGGSSAGKTIAILLIFIDRAQSRKNYLSSVVSETMPHIKRGAERDFLNIMEAHGYYKDSAWNQSDHTYTFETGSKIEFFSADSSDKVRGPRRNGDLFLNECNNIGYETYNQLDIRTAGETFLDYNPVSTFWVHDEIIAKGADHDFLILTYKDNEGLSKDVVEKIESRKNNKLFWQIFGLGQLGELEGKIYNNWRKVDEIPHEARLERYGLDFGYTNDPTAIVSIWYFNGGYILKEELYRKGMSNKDIANFFQTIPPALIIADSAEPKSIDELRSYGLNVMPAQKGKDSVKQGIQLIQDQPISVLKTSLNLIKEYNNYLWMTDKNGKMLNEPVDFNNHCMDATRYAMSTLGRIEPPKTYFDRIWEKELESSQEKQTPNLGR